MLIKELAAATGVDTETIRFYEKEGLLPQPARLANGYRSYEPVHLERLSFVRHCRALDRRRVYFPSLLGGRWCLSHACRSFQKTKAHSSKASHIQVSLADKSPAGMR